MDDRFAPLVLNADQGMPVNQLAADIITAGFNIGGTFHVECYGPDGELRWADDAKNSIPYLTLNNILDVYYGGGGQSTSWYMGIIDNASFAALAATDTMASHTGWVENVNYSGGTRPAWTPGATASQVIQNPSYTSFSMTPTSQLTLKGFFLCSSSTLSGTTGYLGATAALGTLQLANNGDTLKVTYAVSATPN